MPIDWSKITVDHVRQACDLFDAGCTVPKRPAKSTFLLVDGKSYPAKFIRGEAYRLATGVELDPMDFAGGDETARFFANLGLNTSATATVTAPAPPPGSTLSPVTITTTTDAERRYEPQKQALFDLLKKRFGTVTCEAQFSWLVVPKPDEMRESLESIFQALQAMRGFSSFAGAGRSLRCDFYVPNERLIVEYDERQHFTLQRAKSLGLYPADISLGFNRQEWIAACESIKATDPNPPYRDEQRAFYDSLRDILAAQSNQRLVRFRQGDFDWTSNDAEEKLTRAISASVVQGGPSSQSVKQEATEIKKIALASHDYTVPDHRGHYDYSEHFALINKLCDDQGCDTILYALYTWDSSSPVEKTHDSIFNGLNHVKRVILEVFQPPDTFDHVEIWLRGQQQPLLVHQRFATSTDPTIKKQQFVDELQSRQIGTALLTICGETNIASLVRGSDAFYDPFDFAARLRDMKIRVILNPIHDYMRRYEMKEKRRFYSQGGRIVVSVWNQGKGKEAWLPWTVFDNGEDQTERVQELEKPFDERPDIRIGVLDLGRQ